MSVLTEKVRKALFAKLNVANVTNLAIGGVHSDIAPDETPYPFVTFSAAAFPSVQYAFNLTHQAEESWWFIKALADKHSSTLKEPQELAEEILAACETAIGTSLTLSGGAKVLAIYRMEDLPHSTETLADRTIFTRGFRLRVVCGL